MPTAAVLLNAVIAYLAGTAQKKAAYIALNANKDTSQTMWVLRHACGVYRGSIKAYVVKLTAKNATKSKVQAQL